MLNALELRALAYLAAALGFMALGGYLTGLHYREVIASNAAQVANTAALAAVAAKAKQDTADANNQRIVAGLQSQLDSSNAAANSFAVRLRDAEARGRVLPQATGKPGAPATIPQGSSDRLTELLAAAAAECEQNQDRLDALIAEVKPQL